MGPCTTGNMFLEHRTLSELNRMLCCLYEQSLGTGTLSLFSFSGSTDLFLFVFFSHPTRGARHSPGKHWTCGFHFGPQTNYANEFSIVD